MQPGSLFPGTWCASGSAANVLQHRGPNALVTDLAMGRNRLRWTVRYSKTVGVFPAPSALHLCLSSPLPHRTEKCNDRAPKRGMVPILESRV